MNFAHATRENPSLENGRRRPYVDGMKKSAHFETAFWRSAYQALPAQARGRHARHLRAAERWELRLDALIEAWARAKEIF